MSTTCSSRDASWPDRNETSIRDLPDRYRRDPGQASASSPGPGTRFRRGRTCPMNAADAASGARQKFRRTCWTRAVGRDPASSDQVCAMSRRWSGGRRGQDGGRPVVRCDRRAWKVRKRRNERMKELKKEGSGSLGTSRVNPGLRCFGEGRNNPWNYWWLSNRDYFQRGREATRPGGQESGSRGVSESQSLRI